MHEEQTYRNLAVSSALSITDEGLTGSRQSNAKYAVLDLFCGCGGLSSGFQYIGEKTGEYEIVFAADNDKSALETYARNIGFSPDLADLSALDEGVFEALRAKLVHFEKIVVIGGPPCQGFSAHQKKNGWSSTDERNNLVKSFTDFVSKLRPDMVLMENVPEVLSAKNISYFQHLKSTLEAIGYSVSASIHHLAEFGVPQSRFRALVVASLHGAPREIDGFLQPENFKTVRDSIADLPKVPSGKRHKTDPMHQSTGHKQSTLETIKLIPKNGGNRPAGVGPNCLQKVDGFRDVYGRMFWDRPANTITRYARNPASGRYIHPEQDRGLTIREAALLQGFPKNFLFEGSFDRKFAQIGNAVPPIFSAFVAASLLTDLSQGQKISTSDTKFVPTVDSFSSGIFSRKRLKMKERTIA